MMSPALSYVLKVLLSGHYIPALFGSECLKPLQMVILLIIMLFDSLSCDQVCCGCLTAHIPHQDAVPLGQTHLQTSNICYAPYALTSDCKLFCQLGEDSLFNIL